jgi:hypothetical protein
MLTPPGHGSGSGSPIIDAHIGTGSVSNKIRLFDKLPPVGDIPPVQCYFCSNTEPNPPLYTTMAVGEIRVEFDHSTALQAGACDVMSNWTFRFRRARVFNVFSEDHLAPKH